MLYYQPTTGATYAWDPNYTGGISDSTVIVTPYGLPTASGAWYRVEPTIDWGEGVVILPPAETVRERVLRRLIADETERKRALRRLHAAQASRPHQVAPRDIATPSTEPRAFSSALFGFEQRQRWGTRRGNRKAPYVSSRCRSRATEKTQ